MGFLDHAGLACFWGKVKSYVDGKAGSAEEVYSTEERRIGTWIDGKPLYRKTFYTDYSKSSLNATASFTFIFESAEFDQVTNMFGSIMFSNGTKSYPLGFVQDENYFTAFTTASRGIAYFSSVTQVDADCVFITIEYTKKPD